MSNIEKILQYKSSTLTINVPVYGYGFPIVTYTVAIKTKLSESLSEKNSVSLQCDGEENDCGYLDCKKNKYLNIR